MARVNLRILGSFEIADAKGRPIALPTRKAEALLAVLAMTDGAARPRESLTGLLWADRAERQARHSLSQTLTVIRRALGEDSVRADRASVGLAEDRVAADAAAFRDACGGQDYDAASAALALYRGPLLDGFALREDPFERWLADERRGLQERAVELALDVGRRALERGDDVAALSALERAVDLDPLSEPARLALVQHHLERGRPDAAVRQYQSYAEVLRRELDLAPGVEIAALWREATARQSTVQESLDTQGERKHATALAIALSPNLSGSLDAEDVHSILADANRRATEIVRQHGGYVAQGTAEGSLALFGAPVAIEDHAVRACRAGIEVNEAMRRDYAGRLSVVIGLDSGEVVLQPASEGGDSGQQIFGICVHRANRLAASGRVDGVAATRATYDIARSRMVFDDLGNLPLDAGAPLVEVFKPTARPAAANTGREGMSRFVGRDAEVDFLRAAVDPVGHGRGQLVALVGEAGVGKSRLVREFLSSGVPAEWRSVTAAGDPQFADSAYFPVTGLLRSYFELADGIDAETVRARVTSAIETLGPDLSEIVAPLLWTLGDVPTDPEWASLEPQQRRRRLVDAVVALFHRQAELCPLVVVIEDLHWLDAASRHVIESLIETLTAARILLLVNFRPEFAHGWAGRSFYRQLRVEPLSDARLRTLLDSILGEDESVEPIKNRVIERVGGNPFFLEECVKAIEAAGMLEGEAGGYRATSDAAELILPESVHAVIEGRMDRLAQEDKRLLQIASVVGTDVPKGVLRSVSTVDDASFEESLARLQQAEFLISQRVVPDPVYRFRHALTHDVVYGSMLRQARRDLHLRVLESLEGHQSSRASEQVDMLAFHAQRAEDWARAARYGRQAGVSAAARSANREAVTLYRQALAALQQLPETRERQAAEFDVHIDIRNAYFVLGEPESIPDHLQQAGAIAEAIEDRARQCRAELLLSGWFWQSGEHRRALETAERAMTLANGEGDDVLVALTHYRRGTNRHALGDYTGAVEDYDASLEILAKAGATDVFAFGGYPAVFCHSFKAWALAELGDTDAATSVGAEGWAHSERLKNSYSRAVMSFGYGMALLRAGAFAKAKSVLEEGIEMDRVAEAPSTYPWAASALGYALVRLGSTEEGLDLIRRSVSDDVRRRGPIYAHPYLWLAEALLEAGHPEAAAAEAETGFAIAEAQEERGHIAWAQRLLGDSRSAADPVRARAHLEAAASLAEELDMKPLATAARSSLARMKNLL